MRFPTKRVNRFLEREDYQPKDLFDENRVYINLIGGTLSADDTVIEKLYSQLDKTELIGYYWSGKHHKPIKGINLITLYYTDINGVSVPVNYRIYKKSEGKTKNDYLREMLLEVIDWGIRAKTITTDTWYSSKENLNFFKNKELNFQVGLKKNRLVQVNNGDFVRIDSLDIPDDGLMVFLKGFGSRFATQPEAVRVKIFKRDFKHGKTHYYALFVSDQEELEQASRVDFKIIFSIHWGIEFYHRVLKQVCNISKFFVRNTPAILTHIFCALRAFCQLEIMRINERIQNLYEVQKNLYIEVARKFITENFQQVVIGNY